MAVVSSSRSVGSWWKVIIFPCQEMESFNHMEEQFPQKSPRWLPIWTIPVTLISSFLILVMIRPLPWFAGHNYGPKEAVQRRGWLFSLAIGNCIVSFSPSACRIAVFFFRYQVVFFFVEIGMGYDLPIPWWDSKTSIRWSKQANHSNERPSTPSCVHCNPCEDQNECLGIVATWCWVGGGLWGYY